MSFNSTSWFSLAVVKYRHPKRLTCLLTYLLTSWCKILPEQLTGLQLVKKFPAFQGTRRFITALTRVRHLSLSWASPIQSTYPHPTSWRSVLILSTHLRLGLPSGLLPSGFPHQDSIHPSLLTHTCHMSRLQPLLKSVNTRRLKQCWPLDLQGTWGDIAGWIPYRVIEIHGIVAYCV
jgi:hypothetical protein